MNFCEDCGSPLTSGVAFCENCGAKLNLIEKNENIVNTPPSIRLLRLMV